MRFSEWKKYKLGDFAEVQNGYAFKAEDFSEIGIPVIKIKNIISPNISLEDAQCYNKSITDRLKQFLIKKNDVLISMTGSHINQIASAVGKVGKYQFETSALLNQRVGKVYVSKQEVADDKYLFYYLSRYETQFELASSASGSANQANISPSQIKNLEILLPPIQTQQRIASILSSIDDKIELNRQTNKTLETIAQTLFKEMCLPKGEELPEGWEVGRLKDVLEIKYGKDHKHLDNGSIPLYGSGGIMRHVDKALYENESILIPRKGTLSNLFYINKPFWSVDTMFYSKIKKQYHGKFLFHLLQSLNLASMNVGSAVPSLTTEILNNIEINIPPQDILKKFDDLVTPIFQNIEANEQESKTLAILRDSLLPKLMKGEIAV